MIKDIYEKMGLFYLGEDSEDEGLTLYKSKHLTTHAMIVGMTGSGKTGLGISLIEEAILDNIPSIVIDPKGDMGNLCLAFENLDAKKFEPWVDLVDDETQNIQELAGQTAELWRDGLNRSHQDIDRLNKFAKVTKTIYTPGSSAGVGVNILGSFDAPSQEVLDDNDTLTALINATASSLLALVSIESNPVSSKEHLLISNIFYYYWSRQISLTLEDLIGYIASPPFKKVGMLSLNSFYPQSQRMKLVITLNSVISSISFSSWLQGEDLNIQDMLYDEDGKAKIAIFSISHLSDNERMFFVTILLNSYISWMRKQRGSSSLKNILYMDEIFGFFPPVSNPPSKEPMMLLLKQARAFGTGVVLSTQNPVDLDYKGLSNIGTWFVGKLQTARDISKVLTILARKSTLNKKQIKEKIQTLQGRHFFLKNVHSNETIEFSTRWVLSYLKGPMTKDDIRLLMQDKKQNNTPHIEHSIVQKYDENGGRKPILSDGIKQYYIDSSFNLQATFHPAIYASVNVSFYSVRRELDDTHILELKLPLDSMQTSLEWSEAVKFEDKNFSTRTLNKANYYELPTIIKDAKSLRKFKKPLCEYLYATQELEFFKVRSLRLNSKKGQSKQDFTVELQNHLRELRDKKLQKIETRFEKKFKILEQRLNRWEMRLQKEQTDVSTKTTDTIVDVGLAILGAFFGNKTLSVTNMRRGASAFKKGKSVLKEKNDVKNAKSRMVDITQNIEELNETLQNETLEIQDSLNIQNYTIESVYIKPKQLGITVKDIALVWER